MSMKRVALLLSCIGSSVLMASAGHSADNTGRQTGSIPSRLDNTGADVPFDLRAPLPGRPAIAQGPGRGTLLSSIDPVIVPQTMQPGILPGRSASDAKVDESALRFYASQNDAARVSMEIKRIKALHPSWEPPSDLFDETRDPAIEQKLWSLFSEGRLDEIRLAVEDIRRADPTWRPSEKFVQEFERAEVRLQLIAASDAKDAAGVLAVAEARPGMLVCSDVDVMWRVAEALIETGDSNRAQELYRHILTHCPNPAERVATVQKAMELLPSTAVKSLIALGQQRRMSGGGEFEAVRLDLMRRQIGAVASDAAAEPVPPADLRSFETLVRQKKLAEDAVLFGWYHYSQKNWPDAAQWFKQAMEWERLPKAAEGYALALRQQGQIKEAETIAYEWRDASPLIAKLFIEIAATALTEPKPAVIEVNRLAQVGAVVEKAESANGAQALGWYYYNTEAFSKARPWFEKSVSWEADETNALGLALAAHRSKDRALFRKTVAEYGARYPAVAALEAYDRSSAPQRRAGRGKNGGGSQAGQLAKAAVAQFKSGQYREALATLDKRSRIAREDQGLGVLRGWALYQLNQYDKARDQFAKMDKRRSTRDTQYGLYYSSSKLDPTHLGD